MPRHRNPHKINWRINLTLQPGLDDDLIALKHQTPAGRQAAVVKAAMRGGLAAPAAESVTDDVEDLLTGLL